MRSVITFLVVSMLVGFSFTSSAAEIHRRVGAGLEYDSVSGDTDDGTGCYAFYEFDLPEPISIMLELSYVGGDFDVEAGSGSYSSLAVGAAVIFRHELDGWTPYAGFGGANHINDFDNVNYDNKLSMFWLAGGRVQIGERLSASLSLRYRTLRVNADDTTIEPNPINMDAWVVRAGLVLEL